MAMLMALNDFNGGPVTEGTNCYNRKVWLPFADSTAEKQWCRNSRLDKLCRTCKDWSPWTV